MSSETHSCKSPARQNRPFGSAISGTGRHCRRAITGSLTRFAWLALLLMAAGAAASPAPLRVIYPRSESSGDERTGYPLAVLRLALEHRGRAFRLQPSAAAMQQSRSLRELREGRIDVVWTVATKQREAQLRAIHFPIDRGLIGWRVLLIRRGDAARFAAVDSTFALAALTGAQGHDWPDLAVLKHNGLHVVPSPTYQGLFAMLARHHVDYVPRSIGEADAELREHADLPIELERHLLLYYPSALYFFVQLRNEALAAAIRSGLERSLRDGSLRARFDADYAQFVAAASGRHVIRLDNPDLPRDAPLARRELWIRPRGTP